MSSDPLLCERTYNDLYFDVEYFQIEAKMNFLWTFKSCQFLCSFTSLEIFVKFHFEPCLMQKNKYFQSFYSNEKN